MGPVCSDQCSIGFVSWIKLPLLIELVTRVLLQLWCGLHLAPPDPNSSDVEVGLGTIDTHHTKGVTAMLVAPLTEHGQQVLGLVKLDTFIVKLVVLNAPERITISVKVLPELGNGGIDILGVSVEPLEVVKDEA